MAAGCRVMWKIAVTLALALPLTGGDGAQAGPVSGAARPSEVMRLRGGGIAGFQRWFLGQFPDAALKVDQFQVDTFDHVCFDMNP
ncbi:hypothetical protein T484DRAFT_1782184 [Baffinella frigidus]|nr:hypothetical protein T484DRAFT_1782184 [Cryptophyta sp. CCMP2293]